MHVSFDVSHIKQPRRNLYYTKCSITFSNEERAIIRERALYDHVFVFQQGYVNYPPNAGKAIDPDLLKIAYVLLGLGGFVAGFWSPLVAVLSWMGLIALFVYSLHLREADSRGSKQSITLSEVLKKGPFTVCSFENPLNSKLLEHEIREQAQGIKALLTHSGQPLSPTAYEF